MRVVAMRKGCTSGVLVALLGLAVPAQGAAILGQVDTFEDGTTQGWVIGVGPVGGGGAHPAPPSNVPSGGPAGVDDNYLLLQSFGGDGPGSRLAALNLTGWGGDYVSAGIGTIAMDVRNDGASDLALRLELLRFAGTAPSDIGYTNDVALLPAGGDWTRITFRVDASALTLAPIPGSDVDRLLGDVSLIRLFHYPVLGVPQPPPIAGRLGVDNITAGAGVAEVPAPPTLLLLSAAAAAALAGRRRRG